jgi:hypothetical protein
MLAVCVECDGFFFPKFMPVVELGLEITPVSVADAIVENF